MTLPPPDAGSVIRYAYLWADEHAAGREEGRKDRPALVLVAVIRKQGAAAELLVLAITHSAPRRSTDAVPVPPDIARRLGLDAAPAWVVTTEANAFVWPGPDIRPVPNRMPKTFTYGRVTDQLLRQAARSFLANRGRQKTRTVRRSE